jgi:aspartyl-tRNA(Asn)/glutamyl-tRNA(Gln) amidotransferase subunit A
MSDTIAFHSVAAVTAAFAKGEISAVAIANHYLKKIQELNPQLNAFNHLFPEHTLQAAEELDTRRAKGDKLGSLAGAFLGIKDNIHVAGELTTCSSKILKGYRAPFDATAIAHLRSRDALFIGKMNMDEFGMGSTTENSADGPTRNPWNQNCVAGGSSGGSAAGVVAGMCTASLGSDTGGSVRLPAAFCGCVGLKPTYGRVSRYGLVEYGSSLDQIGVLANDVASTALIYSSIAQPCQMDPTYAHRPIETATADAWERLLTAPLHQENHNRVVGIPYSLLEGLSPEARSTLDKAASHLQQLSYTIREVDLSLVRYAISIYYILATAEASTNLSRFDGIRYGQRTTGKSIDDLYEMTRGNAFGPEVKRRILLGTYILSAGYQDAYYKQAQKARILLIEQYQKVLQECAFILMPVATTTAFPLGAMNDPLQMYLQDLYTVSTNLAGLPAIALPISWSHDHLPLGVQLISAPYQEASLLHVGHHLEQAVQLNFQKSIL